MTRLTPIIITQPEYFSAFSTEELESLNLLFFNLHKFGELAWQLFFSIHIFTLGYVIRKSNTTPKWLGLLMLFGGIGYAGDSIIQLTLIKSEILSILFSSLLVQAVISEFWFAFWLMIKGVKVAKISTQKNA